VRNRSHEWLRAEGDRRLSSGGRNLVVSGRQALDATDASHAADAKAGANPTATFADGQRCGRTTGLGHEQLLGAFALRLAESRVSRRETGANSSGCRG